MNENMKVAILGDGTREYGKRIIEYLKSLGAQNTLDFDGHEGKTYWAINPGLDGQNRIWIGAYNNPPSGYRVIVLDGTENINVEQSNLLLLL